MATWDDSELSETSSESDNDCALIARFADTEDDVNSFSSDEAESEEVFSKFTKSELVDSLSEIFEKYNQLSGKYKKL